MNDERITSLVSELIAYDETLKDHEADLHVLVSHMLTEKPTVTVDETFAHDLRARLLSGHLRSVLSPYQKVEQWAFRLMPLGVVALLVLMLLPEQTHYIVPETSPTETESVLESADERAFDVRSGENSVQDTDVADDVLEGTGGGADMKMGVTADSAPAPSTMEMSAPRQEPSPLIINPQVNGPKIVITSVVTETPGFVSITTYRTDGRDELIGVSPLLNPGTTTNVPIYLKYPSSEKRTYTATLHADNGNRVFTKGEDAPVTDIYGNPVIVPIPFTE